MTITKADIEAMKRKTKKLIQTVEVVKAMTPPGPCDFCGEMVEFGKLCKLCGERRVK